MDSLDFPDSINEINDLRGGLKSKTPLLTWISVAFVHTFTTNGPLIDLSGGALALTERTILHE
jgi:hypothetical protein